jgi:hypothetical protein
VPATSAHAHKDEHVKQQTQARLVADRDTTAQPITSMTNDLQAVAAASVGSNLDDEHDKEGSTIAFEREQLAALRADAQKHLTQIDAALARWPLRTVRAVRPTDSGSATGGASRDATMCHMRRAQSAMTHTRRPLP